MKRYQERTMNLGYKKVIAEQYVDLFLSTGSSKYHGNWFMVWTLSQVF